METELLPFGGMGTLDQERLSCVLCTWMCGQRSVPTKRPLGLLGSPRGRAF